MQRYLSIDKDNICNKTVKFTQTDNEFCGTINFPVNGELKNLSDIVPEEASSNNKLVDKKTLEHEMEVSDATFQGTYDSETELPTTGVDKNDYAFVKSTTEEKVTYNKYKWTKINREGQDEEWGWKFEYPIETGVSGGFVKLEDMKAYAIEAINCLSNDSDATLDDILRNFFNHFIPTEPEAN